MYLLDTNVLSELRKVKIGKAPPGVADWAGHERVEHEFERLRNLGVGGVAGGGLVLRAQRFQFAGRCFKLRPGPA